MMEPLEPPAAERSAAAMYAERDGRKPDAMSGWIIFYIICRSIGVLINLFGAAVCLLLPSWVGLLGCVLFLSLAGLLVYMIYLIVRRAPNAVSVCQMYHGVQALLGATALLLFVLRHSYTDIWSATLTLFGSILWWYLVGYSAPASDYIPEEQRVWRRGDVILIASVAAIGVVFTIFLPTVTG